MKIVRRNLEAAVVSGVLILRARNVHRIRHTPRANIMIRVFLAVCLSAAVLGQNIADEPSINAPGAFQSQVDENNARPGRAVGGADPALAPQAPRPINGEATPDGQPSLSTNPYGHELTRAERRQLRKAQRRASSSNSNANVDVAFPFGSVVVRRGGEGGGKNVNVVYPGGSVNVAGTGNKEDGSRSAVDVEYPGGSVHLQPKQPGERRKGVIEFPFGRVVLS